MTPSNDRIFVQIASYRDRECQWTVKDLFEKAARPDRVFVGICWQFVPEEDQDCFTVETRPDQVRKVEFHADQAQGVGWARSQAEALWDSEAYVLQIDSHMRFVPDWDAKMIRMLAACDSPAPILTVYPPRYTPPNDLEHAPPLRVQCADKFHGNGIASFKAEALPEGVATDRPFPTACLAAGFMFGPSAMIETVPYDPGVYFLGEEVSLAARLWTHGFDLFSPNETLLYHYYVRKEARRHWNDTKTWHDNDRASLTRLRHLLEPASIDSFEERIDLGPYGLGSMRTLADYEQFSGLNQTGKTIAQYARAYPYVLTHDVLSTVLEDGRLRTAETAQLFIIDDAGVVFSAASGDIFALNTAATHAWCLLADGAPASEIVTAMADLCRISHDEARDHTASLLTHWEGLGIVEDPALVGNDTPPLRAQDAVPAERDADAPPCPPLEGMARVNHYRLLDSLIEVRYATAAQAAKTHPLFAHLAVGDSGPPDQIMTLAQDGACSFIYRDGDLLDRAETLVALAPQFKHWLINGAVGACPHLLNMHAGVVGNGTACVMLPGAAGSGKTTLTAALVVSGLDYLSDETALLEPETCDVRPVPISLAVKTGGIPILEPLIPGLAALPVHERADGKAVRYPPPPGTLADPRRSLPVAAIVFPRYVAGAETSFTPLGRVEALQLFLQDCVAIPKKLTRADATTLIDWFQTIDCYRLTYDALDDAVGHVRGLLDTRDVRVEMAR